MNSVMKLKLNDVLYCKYPQHGNRNILVNQLGPVVKCGQTYVTIQRQDGSYRSLSYARMVDPVVNPT